MLQVLGWLTQAYRCNTQVGYPSLVQLCNLVTDCLLHARVCIVSTVHQLVTAQGNVSMTCEAALPFLLGGRCLHLFGTCQTTVAVHLQAIPVHCHHISSGDSALPVGQSLHL